MIEDRRITPDQSSLSGVAKKRPVVSRRRFLGLGLSAGAAAFLAACGLGSSHDSSSPTDSGTTPVDTPTRDLPRSTTNAEIQKNPTQGDYLKMATPSGIVEVSPTPQEQGSFFVHVDPLKKNKDGSPVLLKNPVVPKPDTTKVPEYETVTQEKDGRVVALGKDGQPVARAIYHAWNGNGEWEWTVREEALKNFTVREYADAMGQTVGVFDGDFAAAPTTFGQSASPDLVEMMRNLGNQLVVGMANDCRTVFKRFDSSTFQSILGDWENVSAALKKGEVYGVDTLPYDFSQIDKQISLAENNGMGMRFQHMLSGVDTLDSIIDGNFGAENLQRIYEFLIKARTLYISQKTSGKMAIEVDSVDEAAADILFRPQGDKGRYVYDTLGEGIIGLSATWIKECDPNIRTVAVEDHLNDNPDKFSSVDHPMNAQNFSKIRQKFLEDILPNSKAEKVGIENNVNVNWAPTKTKLITTDKQIKDMGFGLASTEITVNEDKTDKFWNITSLTPASDPVQAAAQVYGDIVSARLEVGGDVGFAALSDRTDWLVNVGQPETKAALYDENYVAKPAYDAVLNAFESKYQQMQTVTP